MDSSTFLGLFCGVWNANYRLLLLYGYICLFSASEIPPPLPSYFPDCCRLLTSRTAAVPNQHKPRHIHGTLKHRTHLFRFTDFHRAVQRRLTGKPQAFLYRDQTQLLGFRLLHQPGKRVSAASYTVRRRSRHVLAPFIAIQRF